MFVLQVIGYVIFVYGLLSLVQDIGEEITYQKIYHHMKIVIFAKEVEEHIEQFVLELYNMKRRNPLQTMIVVDLEKEDNLTEIQKRLQNNKLNVEVLDQKEGKKYIENLML